MAHVEFDEATLTTAEERASIHEESQCRKYLVDSPGPAYGGSRGFPKSLATWRTMTGFCQRHQYQVSEPLEESNAFWQYQVSKLLAQ